MSMLPMFQNGWATIKNGITPSLNHVPLRLLQPKAI